MSFSTWVFTNNPQGRILGIQPRSVQPRLIANNSNKYISPLLLMYDAFIFELPKLCFQILISQIYATFS